MRHPLRALLWRLNFRFGPRLASRWRALKVRLRNPGAKISFGRNVQLGAGFSLLIPEGGSFIVGDNVEFRKGFHAEVHRDGRVGIGSGSVLSYYSLIQCSTLVEIGRDCMFGQSTIIVDGQHRFQDTDRPMLEQGFDFRDIHVEDGAVIMTKCTIMADVGKRSIIGANSVVNRDIPAYSVAAGVPAKVVKSLDEPEADPYPTPAPDASQAAR